MDVVTKTDAVMVSPKPGGIRLDVLLIQIGLAKSKGDALRKIKAGAVRINAMRVSDVLALGIPIEGRESEPLLIQIGEQSRTVVL